MSSNGKYVRAPEHYSDSEDSTDSYGGWSPNKQSKIDAEDTSDSCSLDASSEDTDEDNVGDENEAKIDDNHSYGTAKSIEELREENREYIRRMNEMQNKLNRLAKDMDSSKPRDPTPREIEESWNIGDADAGPSTSTGGFRWDNIQPFPAEVPANMMWQEWNQFIDRFEIAVSISNVNDPVKRSKVLFLSMGKKLQGIILAARLRPSLDNPNCYKVFVKNIETYLQSMVDITAEHEAFSNLMQDPDEPTIMFHARLMEKIRLCRYSVTDEERFLRQQLLKGMRNRELAKAARTFLYETTFIVQAATREEAYVAEAAHARPPEAFMVAEDRQRQRRQPVAGDRQRQYRQPEAEDRQRLRRQPVAGDRQRQYRQPEAEDRQRQRRQPSGDRWQRKRRNEGADDQETQPKRQRESEDTGSRGFPRGYGRRARCPNCYFLYHKFGSCPAIGRHCGICGEEGHFAAACRDKTSANNIQDQRSFPTGWEDEDVKKKVNND